MNRLRVLIPGVFLLLAACTPVSNPTVTASSLPLPSVTPQDTETPLPSATPAVIATPIIETATFPPTETALPLPTTTPGTLQLFFPTVIPAVGAEYRPPLYPVPWALSPHDHFYFARPIAATYPAEPDKDYPYGSTFLNPNTIHSGIDMPAPRGSDVLAAGPGTVVWAGPGLYSQTQGNTQDPYGIAVALRHDFGYQNQPLYTIYAHMEETDVVVGQWVKTGDVLGKVGSTGNATGPHLHFEVRIGINDFWNTRNPELWLAPPEGYGVLVGKVTTTGGIIMDAALVVVKSLDNEKNYWYAKTYAHSVVNPDSYYNENFVLGDLPAGPYEITIPYEGWDLKTKIQILPGQVNYFTFAGWYRYNFGSPPAPEPTPTP